MQVSVLIDETKRNEIQRSLLRESTLQNPTGLCSITQLYTTINTQVLNTSVYVLLNSCSIHLLK